MDCKNDKKMPWEKNDKKMKDKIKQNNVITLIHKK